MTSLISQFHPISLEEMGGIRLMNRTDTKFVTTTDKLLRLLQMLPAATIAYRRLTASVI